MPAGNLVSGQLRGVHSWENKCFSPPGTQGTLPFPSPSATSRLTPPEVNAWSGVPKKKETTREQTDNPQVGPVYPKVKEQARANSLFSLQSRPRVRTREGQQWTRSSESLKSPFLWRVSDGTRGQMPREAHGFVFFGVFFCGVYGR